MSHPVLCRCRCRHGLKPLVFSMTLSSPNATNFVCTSVVVWLWKYYSLIGDRRPKVKNRRSWSLSYNVQFPSRWPKKTTFNFFNLQREVKATVRWIMQHVGNFPLMMMMMMIILSLSLEQVTYMCAVYAVYYRSDGYTVKKNTVNQNRMIDAHYQTHFI